MAKKALDIPLVDPADYLALLVLPKGPVTARIAPGQTEIRVPFLQDDGLFGMSVYCWNGVDRDDLGRKVFR